MLVDVTPFQRANRHRRIRRAKGRRADIGNVDTERLGHQRQTDDITHLAAIGRHTERGVTLEVFDRDETLAMRQANIVGGDIVLRIDDGLGFAPVDTDFVNRLNRVSQPPAAGIALARAVPPSALTTLAPTDTPESKQASVFQIPAAEPATCIGSSLVGSDETGLLGIPDRLYAAVRHQVDDRRPATRHQ